MLPEGTGTGEHVPQAGTGGVVGKLFALFLLALGFVFVGYLLAAAIYQALSLIGVL